MLFDLFSRKAIGWSILSRIMKEIVLNALLMAVWRRHSKRMETVHSDHGSQYTSYDWHTSLKQIVLKVREAASEEFSYRTIE